LIACTAAPAVSLDGMALGIYYKGSPDRVLFDEMVDEIAATGATHISLVTQWSMARVTSSQIQPHPVETPSDDLLRRLTRRAKKRGLKVMIFPILWIEHRDAGQWRGTLAPADPKQWWVSYRKFVLHYAELAASEGADIYSVGSELASMESQTANWKRLVSSVRKVFPGQVIYSANWDHYKEVKFWSEVDQIGLTGYYRLTQSMDPTVKELVVAWTKIKTEILNWRRGVGKPLVFTEVGYPSLDGAAHSPWDYTTGKGLDLEEQRRCFEAFRLTWQDEPDLLGVYVWNWWGPKDGTNTWYTLYGKPAMKEIESWLRFRKEKRATSR
jgi:hypothetical protein